MQLVHRPDTKTVAPKIDYDQLGIHLMRDLDFKLMETWTLQKVYVKHDPKLYVREKIKLSKDRIFLNLARLTIQPAA